MNSYSKLKPVKTTKKSNSRDFSDLQPFPDEHTKSTKPQLTILKTQKPKQETNTQDFICSPPNLEHNDEPANPHDNKLGTAEFIRNSSVSETTTSSSGRFELKKPSTSALENAVKKAFSMRRSSSVSERYCRIQDQCVTLASPFNGDDTDDDEKVCDDANKKMQTRSMEMKKKKKYQKYSNGRISKACKRLSNFLVFH